MNYERINWENAPSTDTPLDADNLNKMDEALDTLNREVAKTRSDVQEVEETAASLGSQIAGIIRLEDGSTTGDAELINGRVGKDGTTYSTIGDAIRGQIGDLRDHVIEVSDDEPEEFYNKIWVKDDDQEIEIPTKAELDAVDAAVDELNERLDNVKSDVYNFTDNAEITMTPGAYYDLSGSSIVIGSPTPYTSKKYALVPCVEGDIFIISCYGGATAQPWAFVDSSGNILLKTGNSVNITINSLQLVAPADTAYLVLNDEKTSTRKSYYGRFITDRVGLAEGNIDKEASLSDTGDVLVTVLWEQGAISQEDGSDIDTTANTIRCRTYGYFTTDVKIKVNRSVILYDTYLYYYDADKNFIERSAKYSGESITPDTTYPYYRVAVLNSANPSSSINAIDAENNYTFYKSSKAISSLRQGISDLKNSIVELRIGELINGHLLASKTDTTDEYVPYRLSTTEIVAFPFGSNRKIKVKINKDYLVSFRAGASTSLDVSLYWYSDGDTITIPDGCNYYGVSVCNAKGNGSHIEQTISPSEDIGLKLYLENGFDILNHNDEASKLLSAAKLFFSANERNRFDKYAVIGHTSDCHGDYKRVDNFLRYCENCGADVACITGDIVSYKPSQGLDWFAKTLSEHNVLPAVCTGNHDVFDDAMTDADVYDFVFDDIATKIGNATGKTWYYKDITSKKLRVISINLYQYGGTERWYTHFTDEQLSWLVSTLASTPDDYGIIILTHSPQVNIANAKDPNYGEFFQDTRLYNNTFNAVEGAPVYDIVDAFISRTTLSKTYNQTGSPSSVSVSADFTSVDSSVEFIAHLTGHFHQDSVCYLPGTVNKQLMLNVVCTNSLYGGSAYPYLADIQDLGRCNSDASQDSFNMYVIDRDNKTVKIIRVGSNTTYEMESRKYMEIPYAD